MQCLKCGKSGMKIEDIGYNQKVLHCPCGKDWEIDGNGQLVEVGQTALPQRGANHYSPKSHDVLCECGKRSTQTGMLFHLQKSTTCKKALAYQEAALKE